MARCGLLFSPNMRLTQPRSRAIMTDGGYCWQKKSSGVAPHESLLSTRISNDAGGAGETYLPGKAVLIPRNLPRPLGI